MERPGPGWSVSGGVRFKKCPKCSPNNFLAPFLSFFLRVSVIWQPWSPWRQPQLKRMTFFGGPKPGWPDWANFRPLGYGYIWAVFENYRRGQNFGLHFLRKKLCVYYFWKKRVGLDFGQLFHKLIWSPCSKLTFSASSVRTQIFSSTPNSSETCEHSGHNFLRRRKTHRNLSTGTSKFLLFQ
jgi:hypothetical protein